LLFGGGFGAESADQINTPAMMTPAAAPPAWTRDRALSIVRGWGLVSWRSDQL
jgi:hypothetical protein